MNFTILSINIPDAIEDRVINALCSTYGYQVTLEDGTPNPITKAQFAKQQVIKWIKETVRTAEANQAAETARQAASQKVETEIILA